MARSGAGVLVVAGLGLVGAAVGLLVLQLFVLQWLVAHFLGATVGLWDAAWPLGLAFVGARVAGSVVGAVFGGRDFNEWLVGQIGKLLATAAVWIGVTIYVYDARFWSAVEVAVPMTLLSVVLAVGIELGINKLFGVR